jgi:hypothetical protein
MSRFARCLILALVALWLPATMHCRLEAAELFEAHVGCSSEHHAKPIPDQCSDSLCPTVESSLFQSAGNDLKASAPDAHVCPLLFALCGLLYPEFAASSLSPERFPPPLDLKVAWQFIQRAAPLARAPGLNA